MTLSQAIRKGVEQRPQGFGALFPTRNGRIQGSCALGAAYEGLMGSPDSESAGRYERLLRHFPILTLDVYACPAPGCHLWTLPSRSSIVAAVVTHLNDRHHWSREEIAAWLEIVETRA